MSRLQEAKMALRAAVGEDNFSDEPTICQAYSRGGCGKFFWDRGRKVPGCVVLPGSTQEVQSVVKIANRYRLPFIPIGTFYITLCVPTEPHTIMVDMKPRANRATHGVTIETAKALLEGKADYLVIYDENHSEDEDRVFAIGPTVDGLITVVYGEQINDRIRIISARAATRREQTLFRRHAQGHKR